MCALGILAFGAGSVLLTSAFILLPRPKPTFALARTHDHCSGIQTGGLSPGTNPLTLLILTSSLYDLGRFAPPLYAIVFDVADILRFNVNVRIRDLYIVSIDSQCTSG